MQHHPMNENHHRHSDLHDFVMAPSAERTYLERAPGKCRSMVQCTRSGPCMARENFVCLLEEGPFPLLLCFSSLRSAFSLSLGIPTSLSPLGHVTADKGVPQIVSRSGHAG